VIFLPGTGLSDDFGAHKFVTDEHTLFGNTLEALDMMAAVLKRGSP